MSQKTMLSLRTYCRFHSVISSITYLICCFLVVKKIVTLHMTLFEIIEWRVQLSGVMHRKPKKGPVRRDLESLWRSWNDTTTNYRAAAVRLPSRRTFRRSCVVRLSSPRSSHATGPVSRTHATGPVAEALPCCAHVQASAHDHTP